MTRPTWHTLDLAHPMRSLRAAAGLAMAPACVALGITAAGDTATPGNLSSLTSPELRGTAIQLGRLLARATAYAPPGHLVEVEIRVRWVPTT